MEGRRNKKRKKDRKEEGIQWERRKEKRRRKKKKRRSSGSFKLVRLVLLVFLSVEREGVVGRIGFTWPLSLIHI